MSKPIYGEIQQADPACPESPVGNQQVVEYLTRLKGILTQLNTGKNKTTAVERLDVLLQEFALLNPQLSVVKNPGS